MQQIQFLDGWLVNDQHPQWPWCSFNVRTGELRGPFDTFAAAIEDVTALQKESKTHEKTRI